MKEKIMGVYQIRNKQTSTVYFGSSVDVLGRWRTHKNELRKNCHVNSYFQSDWNKYGEKEFDFNFLEIVSDKKLLKNKENEYINSLGGIDSLKVYNKMDARTNSPNKEVRSKISKAHTGKKLSEETKQKLSDWNKENPNPNFTNRVRTDEEKKKISDTLKAKHLEPWNKGLGLEDERIQNMARLSRERKMSEEQKAKLSAKIKKLHEDGVYDNANWSKKPKMSPERYKEVAKKKVGQKRTPEQCARISEAKKLGYQKRKEQGIEKVAHNKGKKLNRETGKYE